MSCYSSIDIPDDDSAASKELRRRIAHWGIYRYRPLKPPLNDQIGFHSSLARVRLIIGSNRSGKTQCPCAEIAALVLGPPLYPYWFNWQNPPQPPCSVWILVPFFNENPMADARVRKLYLGEQASDENGSRVFRPPLIPPEMIEWHSSDFTSVRLVNGSTIDFKASSQNQLQLASTSVDFIFIDEPTRETHWNEAMVRMMALPGSRLVHSLTDTTLHTRYLSRVLSLSDKVPVFHYTTEANPYRNKAEADEVAEMLDEFEREVRIKGVRRGDTLLCYPDVFRWTDRNGVEIPNPRGSGNWITPFKPDPAWTRYVVHDPGKNNPSAVVWFAVEPNGDIHAYKMLYWRRAPLSTDRLLREMAEKNAGEHIEGWFIDPKAGKQPVIQTEDYYVRGKKTVDLYNESGEKYGITWTLGPPKLEGMSRIDRLGYLHAYLDPLDNAHPMLWIHDSPEFQPLREEFRRYRREISKDPAKNNPETTHEADNHIIYCVEAACIMPLNHWPRQNISHMRVDHLTHIDNFMSNPFAEGQLEPKVRI